MARSEAKYLKIFNRMKKTARRKLDEEFVKRTAEKGAELKYTERSLRNSEAILAVEKKKLDARVAVEEQRLAKEINSIAKTGHYVGSGSGLAISVLVIIALALRKAKRIKKSRRAVEAVEDAISKRIESKVKSKKKKAKAKKVDYPQTKKIMVAELRNFFDCPEEKARNLLGLVEKEFNRKVSLDDFALIAALFSHGKISARKDINRAFQKNKHYFKQ